MARHLHVFIARLPLPCKLRGACRYTAYVPLTTHARSFVAAVVAALAVVWGAASLVSASGLRTERATLSATAPLVESGAAEFLALNSSSDVDNNNSAPILLATITTAVLVTVASLFAELLERPRLLWRLALADAIQRGPPQG